MTKKTRLTKHAMKGAEGPHIAGLDWYKPTPDDLIVESVLDTARRLTHSDRNESYGDAKTNFDVTAALIDAYLWQRNAEHVRTGEPGDYKINAVDVAVIMTLVKVARIAKDPTNRDSVVDAVGYLSLIEQLVDWKV